MRKIESIREIQSIALDLAINFDRIILENVKFEGFNKPLIIAKTKGEIVCSNSEGISIINSYDEKN